eukprot:TRINITY_DN39757_c0_g1_i1.p2 TRINITY_DN39757_c0_g1~~TRINITY_DN39757_c0_g1_i1.p2  ORF type:complete len:119 (-),score=37.09 TRINITY_DN39757_c0_g1_i1:23-379(-)
MCIRDRYMGKELQAKVTELGCMQIIPQEDAKREEELLEEKISQIVSDVNGKIDRIKMATSEFKETITRTVSYTHLRAHETSLQLVCRLLLEKKKKQKKKKRKRTIQKNKHIIQKQIKK